MFFNPQLQINAVIFRTTQSDGFYAKMGRYNCTTMAKNIRPKNIYIFFIYLEFFLLVSYYRHYIYTYINLRNS